MPISYNWRGEFETAQANALHAAAFGTRVFTDTESPWRELADRHSLGWVVARDGDALVGFVNVLWDGSVHAWIQDVMVAPDASRVGSARGWWAWRATAPRLRGVSGSTSTSTSSCGRSTSTPVGSPRRLPA
jgi:hypothetical protein